MLGLEQYPTKLQYNTVYLASLGTDEKCRLTRVVG